MLQRYTTVDRKFDCSSVIFEIREFLVLREPGKLGADAEFTTDTFEAHISEIVKVNVGFPDVFLGKDLIDVVTEMVGNLPARHPKVGKVCVTLGVRLGVPFRK